MKPVSGKVENGSSFSYTNCCSHRVVYTYIPWQHSQGSRYYTIQKWMNSAYLLTPTFRLKKLAGWQSTLYMHSDRSKLKQYGLELVYSSFCHKPLHCKKSSTIVRPHWEDLLTKILAQLSTPGGVKMWNMCLRSHCINTCSLYLCYPSVTLLKGKRVCTQLMTVL